MKKQNVEVRVVSRGVYGSLSRENKYEDDTVQEVMDWLNELLGRIPPEYRASAKIKVDSIGGYSGEHHTEVEVYYTRPETDSEMKERLRIENAHRVEQEARERQQLANLRAKYKDS